MYTQKIQVTLLRDSNVRFWFDSAKIGGKFREFEIVFAILFKKFVLYQTWDFKSVHVILNSFGGRGGGDTGQTFISYYYFCIFEKKSVPFQTWNFVSVKHTILVTFK